MPTLQWSGPGTFSDNARSFKAEPGTEHDLDEEQAEGYLNHDLFGDRWERVDTDGGNATGDATEDDEGSADESPDAESSDATEEDVDRDLGDLDGVGDAKADALREAGYDTIESLREVSEEELANTEGVSENIAERIKADL